MNESNRITIRLYDLSKISGIPYSTLRRRYNDGATRWEDIKIPQRVRREKQRKEQKAVLEKPRLKATPEKAYTESELWTIYKMFAGASDERSRLSAFMGVPADMADQTLKEFRTRAAKEGIL